MGFVRGIANWATGADPWIELLGGNDYTAFVCAGLRIIIKVHFAFFEYYCQMTDLVSCLGSSLRVGEARANLERDE